MTRAAAAALACATLAATAAAQPGCADVSNGTIPAALRGSGIMTTTAHPRWAGATVAIGDAVSIRDASTTVIDTLCVTTATEGPAGVWSLEGKWAGLFTVICVVVRPSVTGTGMDVSFYDGATCSTGDTDFNHEIPDYAFDAGAQALRCPGSALDGTGLQGYGNEAPQAPGYWLTGYSSSSYFTSPVKQPEWTVSVCVDTVVHVPGTSPPVWQLQSYGASATCLGWGCCVWAWLDDVDAPTTGYFKSGPTFARGDCPTNTSLDGPDAFTLTPWTAGDPGPVQPTPAATQTQTGTQTPSPSGTPSGTPSVTASPSASGATHTATATASGTGTPSSSPSPSPAAAAPGGPTGATQTLYAILGAGGGAAALIAGAAVWQWRARAARLGAESDMAPLLARGARRGVV